MKIIIYFKYLILNSKLHRSKSEITFMKRIFYIKSLSFWAVFLILYFAYKFFPCEPLKLICGICESNFQHYKAAYFSWIIVSIFEYALVRKRIDDSMTFFYSRIGTATILPWFVFILWYLAPAIYGRMPSIPLEIVYANIITIAAGIFGSIFEQGLSRINYFRELRIILIILFLSSLILYIVFTYIKLPWADVFIEPDWREFI